MQGQGKALQFRSAVVALCLEEKIKKNPRVDLATALMMVDDIEDSDFEQDGISETPSVLAIHFVHWFFGWNTEAQMPEQVDKLMARNREKTEHAYIHFEDSQQQTSVVEWWINDEHRPEFDDDFAITLHDVNLSSITVCRHSGSKIHITTKGRQ
jgi:hypothetical protein